MEVKCRGSVSVNDDYQMTVSTGTGIPKLG